jgi:hypothetical protein
MTEYPPTPTVEAYLASLPSGVDSYPECQQKASVFHEFLRDIELAPLGPNVPPAIVALVESPPPSTAWLPEVHANAVFLAARARAFADDEAFVRHAYRVNVILLQSPVYAILFRFISPERVLRGATSRWAHFHRGMELVIDRIETGRATVRLVFPPGLMPPLLGRCYATAFRAAIEAAGGLNTIVELVAFDAVSFECRARWS